jgi:hypothetical protein
MKNEIYNLFYEGIGWDNVKQDKASNKNYERWVNYLYVIADVNIP